MVQAQPWVEMAVELRVLGPLEAVVDGCVVPVGRPKARALLAILILHAGRDVAGPVLIDALWGDRPPGNPLATLHSHVAAVRRVLGAAGEVVVTTPAGYRLDVAPEAVDATRFDRLVAEGAAAAAEGRIVDADAAYDAALGLWRGAALADLRGTPALDAAAVHLDEARMHATEQHVDVRLRRGAHHELIPSLQSLVADHPLREGLAGQLMVALYRAGRQAEALAVHTRLRDLLDTEFGLLPGPEIGRLQTAILRHDPSLHARAVAPTGRGVVIGAPPLQTELVGRAEHLDGVLTTLTRSRLVTITGPGGVGKTSLALAVAGRWGRSHDHLVAFVPLAASTDREEALSLIAQAVDAEQGADQPALTTLTAHLQDQPALLVLDNLEQIPEAGAAVVGLLQACAGARVLATSRTALRVGGEHRHPLGPLAVPAADSPADELLSFDAVRLFTDRSTGLTDSDLPAVADLCRILDGLPLAIELVAARTAVLDPPTLLAQLSQGTDVTAAGEESSPAGEPPRPARHRSLRATVEWSHDLLGPAGQDLFACLGAFAGGAPVDAVQSVWMATGSPVGVLEVLSGLVDTGLVRRAPRSGRPRVQLPEPVRAIALEHLEASGRATVTRRAHAAHFTARATAGKPPPGFTDTRRLPELDDDGDNLRAALRWLLAEGEWEGAARLATGLYRWWFSTGRFAEGRRWFEAVLAARTDRTVAPPALVAEILLADGFLAANLADFDTALAQYRASSDLWAAAGVPAGRARAAYGQAAVHLGRNQPALARPHYSSAADLAATAGDDVMRLRALEGLGATAEAAGDVDEAHVLYEQALAAARALGSASDIGHTAVGLALTTAVRGDGDAAEVLVAEALGAARSLDAPALLAEVLLQAAVVALVRGDAEVADLRDHEALALSEAAGRPTYISDALSGLAAAAVIRGELPGAVRQFAAAEGILADLGEPPEHGLHRDVYDRALAAAREDLLPAAFQAAWEEGWRCRTHPIA